MRFLHLADLHLGRSLAEFSLNELQQEFLTEVINTVHERDVNAVIIAGDVYDRSMPSVQAVRLLNGFLSTLSHMDVKALIIAGNHDSAERLSFLSDVLDMAGIYISGEYQLGALPVTLTDEYGPVHFHLMPFFRPGLIRQQAPDERVETYDDAVRVAVEHLSLNDGERNVLIAHQFVCAAGQMPQQSDSEMLSLGGVDLVDARHFDAFDYVALGHLHQAQRVGREEVRYAGAPLKYALGEVNSPKRYALVELGPKGSVSIEQIPICPSIDLRALRGCLNDIMTQPATERDGDFLSVQLTDEEPVYDALQTLRTRYPRVVSVRRERDMAMNAPSLLSTSDVRRADPLTLFDRFCEDVTGFPLTEAEREDVRIALKELHEAEMD